MARNTEGFTPTVGTSSGVEQLAARILDGAERCRPEDAGRQA